ncbi:MAG: DUF3783 domain-containing protein [Oscillospiraceae bacterium]|nr:DUF3783 domain-containing protein [Oscillospiraceae bacterium]
MKARIIPALPETVLSYGIGEKGSALDRITESLGMVHKAIPEDKAGEQVGFLAGYGGFSSNGSSVRAEGECLIFSGIEGNRLDTVLKAIRAEGISIPLKAIVTATNQSQTLEWLLDELAKEHEAMEQARQKKG